MSAFRPALLCAALCACLLADAPAAQIINPNPSERQLRTYVPPGEIVSFGPETSFSQFIQYINPLMQQTTGKVLVDPTGRVDPIGFYVTGMPFRDALSLVLQRAGLTYRETDRYYLIEPVGVAAGGPAVPLVGAITAADRQIRIDALIFELNLDRLREIGTNWNAIFGDAQTGGGGGGGTEDRLRFFLRTGSFFDAIASVIEGPSRIDLAELNRLFRLFETNGLGRTISNPSLVVRSGQEGRIQSGSDIPVTLRDFAGNTVTQFIPTGVIITARPQLIVDGSDMEGGAPIEFIHLVTTVERSAGRITAAGVTIDKNQGSTDLLLLDEEQTLIGGLYTTETAFAHRGIPILKDLPLLGPLFGTRTRTLVQRELLIVLQTSLVDPLRVRAGRPLPQDLIDRERRERQFRLNQSQQGLGEGSRVNDDF